MELSSTIDHDIVAVRCDTSSADIEEEKCSDVFTGVKQYSLNASLQKYSNQCDEQRDHFRCRFSTKGGSGGGAMKSTMYRGELSYRIKDNHDIVITNSTNTQTECNTERCASQRDFVEFKTYISNHMDDMSKKVDTLKLNATQDDLVDFKKFVLAQVKELENKIDGGALASRNSPYPSIFSDIQYREMQDQIISQQKIIERLLKLVILPKNTANTDTTACCNDPHQTHRNEVVPSSSQQNDIDSKPLNITNGGENRDGLFKTNLMAQKLDSSNDSLNSRTGKRERKHIEEEVNGLISKMKVLCSQSAQHAKQ